MNVDTKLVIISILVVEEWVCHLGSSPVRDGQDFPSQDEILGSRYCHQWIVSRGESLSINGTHLKQRNAGILQPVMTSALIDSMNENTAPVVPYVYLYSTGMLHDALPVRVVSSCNLDIYTFPFDIQNCTMTFNSYIHQGELSPHIFLFRCETFHSRLETPPPNKPKAHFSSPLSKRYKDPPREDCRTNHTDIQEGHHHHGGVGAVGHLQP